MTKEQQQQFITRVLQQHMWKYLIPWEVIHHCEVWLGDPLGRFPHLGYLTQITWVTASKNFIGSWIWQFHWSHTSMPVDKELRVTSSVCYRLANKFYRVLWLVHERLDVGSRRREQFSLLALQRSENHQQINGSELLEGRGCDLLNILFLA